MGTAWNLPIGWTIVAVAAGLALGVVVAMRVQRRNRGHDDTRRALFLAAGAMMVLAFITAWRPLASVSAQVASVALEAGACVLMMAFMYMHIDGCD